MNEDGHHRHCARIPAKILIDVSSPSGERSPDRWRDLVNDTEKGGRADDLPRESKIGPLSVRHTLQLFQMQIAALGTQGGADRGKSGWRVCGLFRAFLIIRPIIFS